MAPVRYGHSAVITNNRLYIVGGVGNQTTESCDLTDELNCSLIPDTTLESALHPKLFDFSQTECKLASLSVLILSTRQEESVPVITDLSGKYDTVFNFTFEPETSAYGTCGLLYKDEFYVFGGKNNHHTIAMISGCALKLIGKLPFTFDTGNCVIGGNEIYLCFDYQSYEGNRCRKTQNPLGPFIPVKNSTYEHYYTAMAASGGEYKLLMIT